MEYRSGYFLFLYKNFIVKRTPLAKAFLDFALWNMENSSSRLENKTSCSPTISPSLSEVIGKSFFFIFKISFFKEIAVPLGESFFSL